MTCCVLRSEPEDGDREGADPGPAMDALLSAIVRREERAGHAWVVHVAGPADEVDTVVREAGQAAFGAWHVRAHRAADAGHATFVLRPSGPSASQLIGLDRGQDRVMALLGVRADRAELVARALEEGRDAEAVAAAEVLITQQPRSGRSTIARRMPAEAGPPRPATRPAAAGAAVAALTVAAARTAAPVPAPHSPFVAPVHDRGGRRPRLPLRPAILAAAVAAIAVAGMLSLTRQPPGGPSAAPPAPRTPPVPVARTTPAVFPGVPVGLPIPTGRLGGASAVDGALAETVLFGGSTFDGRVLGDTWTFNGTRWAEPPLRRAPPPRRGAVATWDPGMGEVVVFGGLGASGSPLNDTWTWDGKAWRNLLPSFARPPAGAAAGLTFDTARQQLVLVTAGPAEPGPTGGVSAETWTWTGSSWSRLSTSASPVLTGPAVVTFDGGLEQTILVDVRSSTTWSFDGSSWTERLATGLALDPNEVTHSAFDAVSGAVVLVQNGPSGSLRSTTWTFDGATWRPGAATAAPPDIGSLTPDPQTDGVLALAGESIATDLGVSARLGSGAWGPR